MKKNITKECIFNLIISKYTVGLSTYYHQLIPSFIQISPPPSPWRNNLSRGVNCILFNSVWHEFIYRLNRMEEINQVRPTIADEGQLLLNRDQHNKRTLLFPEYLIIMLIQRDKEAARHKWQQGDLTGQPSQYPQKSSPEERARMKTGLQTPAKQVKPGRDENDWGSLHCSFTFPGSTWHKYGTNFPSRPSRKTFFGRISSTDG